MQVPNPFKLYDLGLIEWVFNPFSWWSEFRFGKDAVHLGTYAVVCGGLLLLVSSYALKDGFIGIMLGFVFGAEFAKRRKSRSIYVRNTKTGLNRLKHDGFLFRIMLQFCLIAFMLLMTVVGQTQVQTVSETLGTVSIYLGVFVLYVIQIYFDSVDAIMVSRFLK